MDTYKLEKTIWTDADFERMGWHDCPIRAISFNLDAGEMLFDIEYIFDWVHPVEGEIYFNFWLAPATLVFEASTNIVIDISAWSDLEIDRFVRSDPQPTPNGPPAYTYTLECQQGEISVSASGYRMFVRRMPILQGDQVLEIDQRGGYAFSRELDPRPM
jgi:hypothetical protein